jgi:hypothetical protein
MAVIKKISELTAKGSNIGANDLVIVGVSNGTDYDLKYVTGNQLVGAAVAQTITNGVTTTAPSQDAVFDALTDKVDKVVGSRLITSAESTLIGNTSGTNTGDETVTTIKSKLGVTTLSGSNTGDQDLSGYQLTSGKDASSGYVGISAGNVITLPLGRGFVSNNVTPNQIAHFDASGNLLTLSVATYPSIAELAYVKGVTSAIQTQINAKVTGSGTSSGTNTGDQTISDATITTTDITTNNFTTAKHGFVPKGTNVGNFLKDDGTWGTPASGSSGGIWGIANASGVYTYYATYQLAVAAAASGKTIEMFGSQTESIANHILKTGVNINYNGYTLTFTTGFGIIDNGVACDVQLLNGEIKKGVSGQIAIYISSSSTILSGNVLVNSSLAGGSGTGSYGYYGIGKVYGLNFKGNDCVYGFASLGDIFNVTVNCTSGAAVGSLASLINSTINSTSTTGSAIASVPLVDGCNIKTNGSSGYSNSGAGIVNNSTFYSLTNRIIDGSQNGLTFNNCSFNSRASAVYNFGGGGGNSVFNNCTLRSLSYVNNYASGGNMNYCTIISETDMCLLYPYGIFANNNFTSLLNSASGRIAGEIQDGTRFISNTFYLTSSSAVALYSTGAPVIYISGNNLKGSSLLKSAGVVNGQTNTADAQGNTILN